MPTNYLRLGARVLILLLILTSTASAGRMTFAYRYEGGNAFGSDWIAAEGDIVDDSADDFEKFLKGMQTSDFKDVHTLYLELRLQPFQ